MQAKYFILNNSLNFDIKFSLPYMKIEDEKIYIPFKEKSVVNTTTIRYDLYTENDKYIDNSFFQSFCSNYHILQIDLPAIHIAHIGVHDFIRHLYIKRNTVEIICNDPFDDISDDQRQQILAIKMMQKIS